MGETPQEREVMALLRPGAAADTHLGGLLLLQGSYRAASSTGKPGSTGREANWITLCTPRAQACVLHPHPQSASSQGAQDCPGGLDKNAIFLLSILLSFPPSQGSNIFYLLQVVPDLLQAVPDLLQSVPFCPQAVTSLEPPLIHLG